MFKNRSFSVKLVKDSDPLMDRANKTADSVTDIIHAKAYAGIVKDVVEDVTGTVVIGAIVVIGFKTVCTIVLHTTRALLR